MNGVLDRCKGDSAHEAEDDRYRRAGLCNAVTSASTHGATMANGSSP